MNWPHYKAINTRPATAQASVSPASRSPIICQYIALIDHLNISGGSAWTLDSGHRLTSDVFLSEIIFELNLTEQIPNS